MVSITFGDESLVKSIASLLVQLLIDRGFESVVDECNRCRDNAIPLYLSSLSVSDKENRFRIGFFISSFSELSETSRSFSKQYSDDDELEETSLSEEGKCSSNSPCD